jgi:hypothetical protein
VTEMERGEIRKNDKETGEIVKKIEERRVEK